MFTIACLLSENIEEKAIESLRRVDFQMFCASCSLCDVRNPTYRELFNFLTLDNTGSHNRNTVHHIHLQARKQVKKGHKDIICVKQTLNV